MLIEFSTENFRSIKDEVRLSLVAGAGKELYDTNVTEPQMPKGVKSIPLLRSAALYGPNAGGKSNIIKALATMQRIVMTSSQQLEDLPVVPFRLSRPTLDKPSAFEVIILSEGVRYQYGFSATSEAVHDEWLFAFPKGRTQTWFERSLNLETGEYEYNFGDKLTGDKDVWRRATRPNALFLSTAIQLNSQQLQPVFNWFANRLRIAGVGGWSPHFSMQWCKDDRKEKVLDFLKAADFAISDVRVAEEDFSSDTFPPNLPSHVKKFLEYELKDKKRLRLITSHKSDTGDMVELDLDEESDGTRKMFSFAGPWLDSLEKGHVLFIDELHDNLHPLLVKFLVELFHNSDTNSNFAQLIFSTHETSILSQDVFRRDQIWFCDRAKTQDTKLYPLTEFSPRKGVENLERAYLSGRYGALPFLRAITQNFGG
ncbi:RloA protein [Marinobacter lutaoensis]|uniref:RloA protein n=1 Tax=Marinobacter lutaoensis TaxID=135739 RepID=A0A1V2DRS4_9GAMM|nr:ATP-binding protein [Marinobacter lutaoensis]ONF43293.1 RloA protein [Marinobacter lutaoensis]